jgi:hypothetical protein
MRIGRYSAARATEAFGDVRFHPLAESVVAIYRLTLDVLQTAC